MLVADALVQVVVDQSADDVEVVGLELGENVVGLCSKINDVLLGSQRLII